MADREKTRAELISENNRLRTEVKELENAFEQACAANDGWMHFSIKMKKERDAAVADLAVEKDCRFCKFYDKSIRVGMYCGREDCDYGESDKWEWRGVQDG